MLSLVLTALLLASLASPWPTLPKFLDQSANHLSPHKDTEGAPGWTDPREGGGRMLDVCYQRSTCFLNGIES